MLFSAGVGIGILFFGAAEPVFYFDNSEPWGYPNNPHADMDGATALSIDRAVAAMRVTYFHWGSHAWSVYVIVGLCLAYFGFRKKLPLTLRSSLYPLIGEHFRSDRACSGFTGRLWHYLWSGNISWPWCQPDGSRTRCLVWLE